MGYYKQMIEDYMKSNKSTEAQALKVIELTDAHVFEVLRERNKAKYWAVMRGIHEIYEGCHYNETFGIWEVDQMSHKTKMGIVCNGAHWSIEEIERLFKEHRAMLKSTVTLYDFYVALHSWWHDNIEQDKKDFVEKAEEYNIKRAINYFFKDDDAPDGKIWCYYKGMHNSSVRVA